MDFLQDFQELSSQIFEDRRQQWGARVPSIDSHESPLVAVGAVDEPGLLAPTTIDVSMTEGTGANRPFVTGTCSEGLSFSLLAEDGSGLAIALASCDATVAELLHAESGLCSFPAQVRDCVSDQALAPSDKLLARRVRLEPLLGPAAASEVSMPITEVSEFSVRDALMDIPPTVPFMVSDEVAQDPLASLSVQQLVALDPPKVVGVVQVCHLIAQRMDFHARVQILSRQQHAMADDEIRYHVFQILLEPDCTHWTFLDPLLAHRLLESTSADLVQQWFCNLSQVPSKVVVIVPLGGHWIPVLLCLSDSTLEVLTWSSVEACKEILDHLVHSFRLAWNVNHLQYFGLVQPCIDSTLCGISSLSFVRHVLLNTPLADSFDSLLQLHELARRSFGDSLLKKQAAFRPWVWALGLDPQSHARLESLLGVPAAQLQNRIQLAIQAIGLVQVQKSLLSGQPWRSLKSLGNQQRPPFQWVLKAELDTAVAAKSKTVTKKSKGSESKKLKQLFSKPIQPSALDPSKLAFEAGVFVSKSGKKLSQIQPEQLGPFTEGVALANSQMVEQFLKSPSPITDLPVGVMVLDLSEAPEGLQLPWQFLRLAVRCVANGEPVLVSGILVMLGRDEIIKFVLPVVDNLPTAEVACTKLAEMALTALGLTLFALQSLMWCSTFSAWTCVLLMDVDAASGIARREMSLNLRSSTYGENNGSLATSVPHSHKTPRFSL